MDSSSTILSCSSTGDPCGSGDWLVGPGDWRIVRSAPLHPSSQSRNSPSTVNDGLYPLGEVLEIFRHEPHAGCLFMPGALESPRTIRCLLARVSATLIRSGVTKPLPPCAPQRERMMTSFSWP